MRFMKLNHNQAWFKSLLFVIALLVVVLSASGCMRDMQDQSRYKPLEKSDFFSDGRSSRPLVKNTVSRGNLKTEDYRSTGIQDGDYGDGFPEAVTREMLERGRNRFDIYCSVCHGKTGYGDGMVVQRGFPAPPPYHIGRLQDAPDGYIFNVITNGFGKMASYSDVLDINDRWAVVAYVRALQKSQNMSPDELSAREKEILQQVKE